jgi:hypothetical protein
MKLKASQMIREAFKAGRCLSAILFDTEAIKVIFVFLIKLCAGFLAGKSGEYGNVLPAEERRKSK